MTTLSGKAHVYGDHIDTDRIIAGKYTKTLDLDTLSKHLFEDLDPAFVHKIRKGDILAAGKNFGCGSSREQAPLALQHVGIIAVVASSFSRIFFRNAINIGLPVLEIGEDGIEDGSELEINLSISQVYDLQKDRIYHATPLPPVMLKIFQEGGLVPYLKKHGRYPCSSFSGSNPI